ncbi:Rubredoxin [Reichenbachiella faecimaris]|uniref:Rubredoxin n=1 Tax=Reichenbachiella faecimaris TaxID=692418 RepID=A0A1W2GK29_REIFA|nr:rubredoxin domain-containing protein [Reichenbachiella faecimaris]SMD36997.1 Rubredoxin [Reichenbachiella faecimaris]
MEKKNLVRVFVKGGILSPGDFLQILTTAKELGTEFIHLGSRQDILFPAKDQSKALLQNIFKSINTEYEINEFTHQNIVSSYVALDVMPNKKWLVPHVYHYILDSFDFRAKYRINLVDPSQSMVPLFTGNINFIATSTDNYWYMYLRLKQFNNLPIPYAKIIHGYDLAKAALALNELELNDESLSAEDIFSAVDQLEINTLNPVEDLNFPEPAFPYYEGLNREPGGNYWLGIYWRNNKFSINFLIALCKRCMETNVGKISLTPWKSLIVKGIEENYLVGWEKLMGRFGINMRHSSLELNWHLPVLSDEALELKNYLVRALDQQDISTSGLTFTIKPNDDIYLFTSVVIEINTAEGDGSNTYNILYAKSFNPNSAEYVTYVKNVTKNVLPALLMELSVMYFDQIDDQPKAATKKEVAPKAAQVSERYQCKHCLTIYDAQYGDEAADIAPGTLFDKLPDSYICPTCEAKKQEFVVV